MIARSSIWPISQKPPAVVRENGVRRHGKELRDELRREFSDPPRDPRGLGFREAFAESGSAGGACADY
jgi:hypothetical protein